MRRYNVSFKAITEEKQDAALRELKYRTMEDLHAALGHGKITPQQFVALVSPDAGLKPEEPSLLRRVSRALTRTGKDKVLVHGMGDTLVTLARCCCPIPGDAIIGYITRGRGVSVHRDDCSNLEGLLVESDRRIEVAWAAGEDASRFNVGLRILTRNQPGMLARVAEILEKERINIGHADAGVDDAGRGLISIVAEVAHLNQVEKLLERIRRTEGVYQVERVSPQHAAGQIHG
jgi:GTP pyrophosphokinase